MEKLTFTLKQHTPMLHFQHSQENATLRATEVKPRFDRWLISKVWGNRFADCKEYLIGYDARFNAGQLASFERKFNEGFRALNYKMRIECTGDRTSQVKMEQITATKNGVPVTHKLLGSQLQTTSNYPSNKQSVIMSNIGGRLPEEVLNFTLYDSIKVIIHVSQQPLAGIIKSKFEEFILSNNFGNRKSKGFGSFVMSDNNGSEIDEHFPAPWIMMTLKSKDGKTLNTDKAYKDIFMVINKIWRKLKSHCTDPDHKAKETVLLGQGIRRRLSRIPSPIIFKPVILAKEADSWKIAVELIYEKDVISKACEPHTENTYDGYINELQDYLTDLDLDYFAQQVGLFYSLEKLTIE